MFHRGERAMARFTSPLGIFFIAFVGMVMDVRFANSQAPADASDAELLELLTPELNDVRLLTMQDLTPEEISNIGNTPEVDRRFEGDFNADGQVDLALLGSDSDGTFFLLATRDQTVWRRSGLLRHDRQFVVGRLDQGILRIFFCTGCDSGMRVMWTGTGYELSPFPPQGVPGAERGRERP